MADKQIIALTERAYANMAATDVLPSDNAAGTTCKVELQDLKQYFLENRTIGGTATGDIMTCGGTQTGTNKTFQHPTFTGTITLGTTALTVVGAELNQLAGKLVGGPDADDIPTIGGTETLSGKTLASPTITGTITVGAIGISATELGYLDGATSNLQAQITGLDVPFAAQNLYQSWSYSAGWTEGTTTESWTAAAMMTAIGIDTGAYVMDPTSVLVQTYILAGGTYTQQLDAVISYTTATSLGQTYVDTLTVANLTATTHSVVCNFKILAKAGV
jgi:hypothetical protein